MILKYFSLWKGPLTRTLRKVRKILPLLTLKSLLGFLLMNTVSTSPTSSLAKKAINLSRLIFMGNPFCEIKIRKRYNTGIFIVIGFSLGYGDEQYFSYIVAVSFFGGGKQCARRKPQTSRNLIDHLHISNLMRKIIRFFLHFTQELYLYCG